MESPQPADPPDINNEVKLRILGGDPKASDAFFQNSLATAGLSVGGGGKTASSKSPEEFQKGVPRDIKVPGGMIALLEDQNKNRLKSATTMTSHSPVPVTDNRSSNGKSESGTTRKSSDGSSSSSSSTGSNHVEIDVDMTLPQPPEVVVQKDDALASSSSARKEITCNGQSTSEDCSTTIIANHVFSVAQTSHHSQNHEDQQQQQHEVEEQSQQQTGPNFPPSREKDLEILKNVRKVILRTTDDRRPWYYAVSDEDGTSMEEYLFETYLADTNGSIWSRYFKVKQKVMLLLDKSHRIVLKLEFGRSRTISCCQTLRFAAMTASFMLKKDEPLCIIFKDKECCINCCCCPEATYETVPQLDTILPFSVFTKGRWKNRAELMVKHNDGSILGFIDKEQDAYRLTMGENLRPAMKACLIGFLIAMDVLDRKDVGKFSCYLRPTTILLISLLLMLCITIGAYLLHHFSFMFLSFKEDNVLLGGFDEAGSRGTAPVPHFNNDRTSDFTTSSGGTGAVMNASATSEFHFGSSSSSSSATLGGNNSATWPL